MPSDESPPSRAAHVRHEQRVRVRFALPRDDSGWPPVESEALWASPTGGDRFLIDNAPWFVRGISAGDTVRALAGGDGVLWATGVVARGGRSTVRVVPWQEGPLRGDVGAVVEAFTPWGVGAEGTTTPMRIVALDIGPDVDLVAVKDLLREGEADARWAFEEGCVTPEWMAL